MSIVQFGDVVAFAKLAAEVYQYGWNESYRADTQYAQFGREVKSLARNADLLVMVVQRAQDNLKSNGAVSSSRLAWDQESLFEILGDYSETLRECQQLVDTNRAYQAGAGSVLANVQWNFHVQPTVDRLRNRLILHTSRIQHALLPFEFDLMTRIQQQLSQQIGNVQASVDQVQDRLMGLIGVLVPDLHAEIRKQETQTDHSIPIPPMVQEMFHSQLFRHPDHHLEQPSLQVMSDAFILAFDKSTKTFQPGLTVDEKTPDVIAYVSLLKCVFLMGKMKESQGLRFASRDSHWPSYVRRLDYELSIECWRFTRDMMPPNIDCLPAGLAALWQEEEPVGLLDIVPVQLMMEKVHSSPLSPITPGGTREVKLLRHSGAKGQQFRLIITATNQSPKSRVPTKQREVVDFDLGTSSLNPQYALEDQANDEFTMVLSASNKSISLKFLCIRDALKFQRALTGFRAWGYFSRQVPKVAFFANGKTVLYTATLQLWVPDKVEGVPVPSNEAEDDSLPSPSTPSWASPVASPVTSPTFASVASPSQWTSLPPNGSPGHSPDPGSNPSRRGTRYSIKRRSQASFRSSIVSAATTRRTSDSSSSASERTVLVASSRKEAPQPATLYFKPIKPMLVVFARNESTGDLRIVTLSIDCLTKPNPERCNCKLALQNRAGGDCHITAIEQKAGGAPLDARIFGRGWDVCKLAASRMNDPQDFAGARWDGLKRASIAFHSAADRVQLVGHPCMCRIRTNADETACMVGGHVGLLGETRIRYRRQLKAYVDQINGNHDHVIMGRRT